MDPPYNAALDAATGSARVGGTGVTYSDEDVTIQVGSNQVFVALQSSKAKAEYEAWLARCRRFANRKRVRAFQPKTGAWGITFTPKPSPS